MKTTMFKYSSRISSYFLLLILLCAVLPYSSSIVLAASPSDVTVGTVTLNSNSLASGGSTVHEALATTSSATWEQSSVSVTPSSLPSGGGQITVTIATDETNMTVSPITFSVSGPGFSQSSTATAAGYANHTTYISRGWQSTFNLPANSTTSSRVYSVTASSSQVSGSRTGSATVQGQPQPTIPATPSVRIESPETYTPNTPFEVIVYLKNTGGSTSGNAYLDISFPDNPAISILDKSNVWDNVQLYDVDYYPLYTASSDQIKAMHKLVSGYKKGMDANEEQWFKLSIISADNSVNICYRGTIGDTREPSSGTKDQQGWYVYEKSVNNCTPSIVLSHDPVLLIYGFDTGWNNNPDDVWSELSKELTSRLGWVDGGILDKNISDQQRVADFYKIKLSSRDSLTFKEQGDEVSVVVGKLNKWTNRKVILIGHSMGGLSARAYLENYDTSSTVSGLITIDTPHYGSNLAYIANAAELTSLSNIVSRIATIYASFKPNIFMLQPDSPEMKDLNENIYKMPLDIPYITVLKPEFGSWEEGTYRTITNDDSFKSAITEFSFGFVGAQPGRWRVRANNEYGRSNWSEWWYFRYTR